MCDEVQEVDSVPVEGQNVVGALFRVGHPLDCKETGSKEGPLGQQV